MIIAQLFQFIPDKHMNQQLGRRDHHRPEIRRAPQIGNRRQRPIRQRVRQRTQPNQTQQHQR